MKRDAASAAEVQTRPPHRFEREPRIDIVTTSYAPDFEGFSELHASVLRHTSPGVVHRLIVPKSDVVLFGSLRSDRLEISCTEEKLPAHFWSAQYVDVVFKTLAVMASPVRKMRRSAGEFFVNTRRIWPPVRGWILQQIVKLAAVAESDADIVITIDSDVALIRPIAPDDLWRDGTAYLYEWRGAIHDGMRRHLGWCRTARDLLGAPPPSSLPESDHIASLMVWDPRLVRAMHARLEAVNQAHWADVLASRSDFSECILYGIFVREFGSEENRSYLSQRPLSHGYWDTRPLDESAAHRFAEELRPEHMAIHVQSTSDTRREVRRSLIRAAEDRVAALRSPVSGQVHG